MCVSLHALAVQAVIQKATPKLRYKIWLVVTALALGRNIFHILGSEVVVQIY
jgi:hypothetical protein